MSILNTIISRTSLRHVLVLATLSVALPALVLIGVLGVEQFKAKQSETENHAIELASQFAMKHDDVLLQARTLLQAMTAYGDIFVKHPGDVRQIFEKIVSANSQYAYLTMAGTDGFLMISSSSADTSINFTDREVFRAVLAGSDFSVGQTIISKTTGLPVLPFASPVKDAAGKIMGVLLLGLKVDEYNVYFSSIGLPVGSRVVLFAPDGRRLLRYPQDAALPVGGQLFNWSQIESSRQSSGTFSTPGPEGLPTRYAFSKLRPGGDGQGHLGVLIAIPEPPWRDLFWPVFGRTMLLLSGTTLLLVFGHLVLGNKIVSSGIISLAQLARTIPESTTPPTLDGISGCKEVEELKQAFAKMAWALARDRDARDKAQEALRVEIARQRVLLESALDGIHVLNERGDIVVCSPSFASMLGYSLEEAGRLNIVDWDAGFEPDQLLPALRRLFRDPACFETRHRRKDGQIIEVEINSREIVLEGDTLLYNSARDISERKRAESSLRDLEKSHRELIEHAPIGILKTTPDGRYIEVNPWLAAMYGYENAQALQEGVRDINKDLYVDPDDRKHLLALAEQGEADRIVGRRRRKDGSIIWVATSMRAVRDEKGVVTSYEGFSRDITKLHLMEENLLQERSRLSAIIEGTNVGTWEWNVQTGEAVFNKKWAEMLGYSLAELAPVSIKTWEALAHPGDLAKCEELLGRHFSGDLPFYEAECRMRHKDGRWIWALDRGRLYSCDEKGGALMMYGTHQDLTARKLAEERLRESEELYRATFEGTEAMRLIIDPVDGSIVDANRTAVLFYGYSLEQLKGLSISEINTLSKENILAELEKAARQEKQVFNLKHRLANGDVRDVEAHVCIIQIGGEKRVMSTIHDVTELRRMEQVKRDVDNIIRHDLKAPLDGIINIPMILLDEEGLNAEQRELLQLVVASGKKMLHQINSTQAMHKLETGNYSLVVQEIDPVGLVRDNLSMLTVSSGLDSGVFRLMVPEGRKIVIRNDRLLMDVALMNLLRNAMEAREPGEIVNITCSTVDEMLSIATSNLRPVPMAIRDHFFEKYATSGKAGGTGLGTYSAALMVRAMRGEVYLETSDEAGTTVTVQLPLDI